jgi:hypothetical protein
MPSWTVQLLRNFHVKTYPWPNASSMSLADVAPTCARQNLLISPYFSPSGTFKAWLDKQLAWCLMLLRQQSTDAARINLRTWASSEQWIGACMRLDCVNVHLAYGGPAILRLHPAPPHSLISYLQQNHFF